MAGQTGEAEKTIEGKRHALRLTWVTGDRLDLLKAFFLGLTFTAIFYEVFPLPLMEAGRILSVFDNAVSEAIVALTAWALFLLAFKALRHRADRTSFSRLGSQLAREVLTKGATPTAALDLGAALSEVVRHKRSRWVEDGLVLRRLAAVSRLVDSHATPGVHNNLLVQSEIDERRLEASYTAIRVFIWAIPILGFVGTVLGIGDAIVEFSHFVQGADPGNLVGAEMRAALGGVTGGLAIAFNTTLLSLALTIPVMLWGSLLQKWEEELLLSIDEFCLWELAGRLKLPWDGEAQGQGVALGANAGEILAQLERAVAQFAKQADLTTHQLAGVQPLVKDFTDRLLEAPDRGSRNQSAPDPSVPKREAELG